MTDRFLVQTCNTTSVKTQ